VNPRQRQRWVVIGVIAAAVILFLMVVAAHYAHASYAVWGSSFFLSVPLTVWRVIGVIAFLTLIAIEIYIYFNPALWIRVVSPSPRVTGPQLHVRCKTCEVVHWIEDEGRRPIEHTCPSCGTTGSYGGPERGEKDFLYTKVEIKLGCTRCNTAFTVPEPLVRPLYTNCPNCKAVGVLGQKARAVEAEEAQMQCPNCSHAFHVYGVKGEWHREFHCPRCNHRMQAPAAPTDAASGGPQPA
jgi:Zn finger protein HypA/HybF involved in hydrogenase expression